MSRRFTTWLLKNADGETLEIEVRTERNPEGDRFFVNLRNIVPLEEGRTAYTGTDVQQLEEQVKKIVAKQGAIAWAPWLQIKVRRWGQGDKPGQILVKDEGERGCGLDVDVTPVDLGTRTTGEKVHREHQKGNYRDLRVESGWPDAGEDDWHVHNEVEMVALVKDTEENRTALNAIFAGMERLSEALQALMAPERIEQTLVRALQTNLLPAPPEE
ncbi:unnamed protein product [marine sediment metagenome]|uniref:Uncharacterized protein n=1 Tax=marine sediment metagenome TaxID=412755 RepID=X0UBI7_9ZZZZ